MTADARPRRSPGRAARARGRLPRPCRRLWGLAVARPLVVAGLLLAALDLLLVYPAVLGGRVLAPEDWLLINPPLAAVRPASLLHPSNYLLSDAVVVFHPDLEWARATLLAGHLPLWNPYIFGGYPLFASQQTAMLFPLTALAYVLPFWPALGIIAVLKALLAGLGTVWLCLRLHLRLAAALLAAVTYSLGSYFVIWLEHPQTNVYALIPWLLGTIELVCARRRVRDAALVSGVVALCLLGGHPESTFIAAVAAVAFAGLCLTGPRAAGGRRRSLLLLAGGVVLGLAGAAVMLVPFAQLADQAPHLARGGGAGMPGRSLLSLLLPDLWGRPDTAFEAGGPVNYAERTIYVGVLPLMLAAAGLWRPRAREHRFFAGLLLGGLVLAVHVPGLTAGLDGLPGFSYIDLYRAVILAVLGLAIMAAYGLDRLLAGERGQRRPMLALAVAVGVIPIVWLARNPTALHSFPRFSDIAPSLWGTARTQGQTGAAAVTRWLACSLVGLVLLGLIARCAGGRRPRATVVSVALVVGLAAADLLALNHGYHPAISRAQAAPAATPSLVIAAARQGSGRSIGIDQYLFPNVGTRYGLRDPRGHELPALARYFALWDGLGGFGYPGTLLGRSDRRTGALLDDFAVTTVLTAPRGRAPATPGGRLVARERDGAVYRNVTALPRAYLATSWRAAGTREDALRATLASTAARLRVAPVIEGAGAPPAPGAAGDGRVTFGEDAAGVVRLETNAARAGYLVLLDSYFPGWIATVDGRGTPIRAANEAFRAVAVPSGRHRVVFRYQPARLRAAAVISAVAWMVTLCLLGIPRLQAGRTRARTRS